MEFLVDHYIFFSTLTIPTYWLLISQVSDEKTAYWQFLVYVISVSLYWDFQDYLSIILLKCFSVEVKFVLFGVHWASWIFICMSFITFGKVLAIISHNYCDLPWWVCWSTWWYFRDTISWIEFSQLSCLQACWLFLLPP